MSDDTSDGLQTPTPTIATAADLVAWQGCGRIGWQPAHAKGCRPSTEFLALLRGVMSAPDEDAPRLVLADWLQEHGDEERANAMRIAEFRPVYRSALYRQTLGETSESMRGMLAGRDSLSLVTSPGDVEEPAYVRDTYVRVEIRHGFVTVVRCTAEWFRRNVSQLCRRFPVRAVRLFGFRPSDNAFLSGDHESRCWGRGGPLYGGGMWVPGEIFDLLAAGRPGRPADFHGQRFSTMCYRHWRAAKRALATACLTLARAKANVIEMA